MSLIASVIVVGVLGGAQQAKTFRDDDLGLIFQHPASWTLKKQKYSTDLEIPLSDGSKAVVQIFRTSFRQGKDVWQGLQKEVTLQMARHMTRQWEETILGVPLLLSRIDYTEGAQEMSIFVGLLYTATDNKLNFRVNSSAKTAQEAEDAWRAVLLSLRTTNGELPMAEDPNRNGGSQTTGSGGQRITALKPDAKTNIPVRTKNVAHVSALGNAINVYMPDGWTLKVDGDATVIANEKLKGTVQIKFSAGGRSQLASVLNEASESALTRFSIVALRTDQTPTVMKSGSLVASTLRTGKDEKGAEACVWHIVGTLGTIVWQIDYSSSSATALESDRKAMEKLRDYLAVEIAQ